MLYNKDRELDQTRQFLENKKAYDRGMNLLRLHFVFVPTRYGDIVSLN